MKHILLICLALLSLSLHAEIRSVWVLPWDITSPQAIDEVVQSAVDNNQNELLVEVRYRSDALYDTSLGADRYPNPEPRSYVLKNNGFDPLAYVLQKGHAAGLQVQAWVIVFNATPLDNALIQQNYIYQNHRDWITQSNSGQRFNGTRQFGYFLDPGVPEVQDYLLIVFSNLAAGYPDLNGIHLDYIRYPESSLGYHPVSVLRYEEYCRNQMEITFNEWRIMQVSSFVEKVHFRLKEINPLLRLTAAVFADIADANVAYAQDWPDWLRRGIIDQAYPMAYNVKYDTHKSQLERMKLIGTDERIIIGHRAWDDKNRSLAVTNAGYYNVNDISKRIVLARELGFGGVAMFSYAGLKVGNAWQKLKDMAFQEPAEYPHWRMTSLESVVMNDEQLMLADLNSGDAIDDLDRIPALAEMMVYETTVSDREIPAFAGMRISNTPQAKLIRNGRHLTFLLTVPSEGYWQYQLFSDRLLLENRQYFKEGEAKELYELLVDEYSECMPEKVVLHLSQTDSDFSYMIPFDMKEIHE